MWWYGEGVLGREAGEQASFALCFAWEGNVGAPKSRRGVLGRQAGALQKE